MGKFMKRWITKISIILFAALVIIGCQKEDIKVPTDPLQGGLAKNSCEGCHTNYDLLKQIHSPDTVHAAGGCGGDAPHIEPYDRVYLGGTGYSEFKNTYHGKMKCTTCHNGVDGTDDKKLAHTNNFIKHPSKSADEKCASCHPSIVANAKNSIHEQGTGQKSMVTLRSGLGTGLSAFDQLTDAMKDAYGKNCATCHASCGDCHVNRPSAGGGGLYKGHQFVKPDMRDHCTTCHTSRGGHAYYGVAAGTQPDVHLTKKGFTCMDCHSKHEVHGDGNYYDQRYKMASLPKCSNCHTNINNSNAYHLAHFNTFNCNTCHSQDYNNCGSCHIGGAGARIPSYQGFKIAMNPIPQTKPYKLATVRRSLMAPDSWKEFGVTQLPNFDVRPTYKYTTPHNILKWTSRTQVAAGKACYDNCHIVKEGNNYRNKSLYLFNSDLIELWEISANQGIIVDGKLPANWFQ
jgi:hypothetical protein